MLYTWRIFKINASKFSFLKKKLISRNLWTFLVLYKYEVVDLDVDVKFLFHALQRDSFIMHVIFLLYMNFLWIVAIILELTFSSKCVSNLYLIIIRNGLIFFLQLFWEKKLSGLNAYDIAEELVKTMDLPKGLQGMTVSTHLILNVI